MAPVALALLTALVVSFLMTPVVKSFAYKVGAIDVPKDDRRMHNKPIPRLGGLAIFVGFMVSILLFVEIRLNPQMQSILLGAVIIVVLGVVDDIMALPRQAEIRGADRGGPDRRALHGVVIQAFSNPNVFSPNALLGARNWLSIPVTVLVDRRHHQRGEPHRRPGRPCQRRLRHLRHHSAGDRPASSPTAQVAVVMAALVGACVGFMPYNMNPAKMFMGDTGARPSWATFWPPCPSRAFSSIYAIISFAVPFLILGLPIFDTAFAIIRRIAHGQSPMRAGPRATSTTGSSTWASTRSRPWRRCTSSAVSWACPPWC